MTDRLRTRSVNRQQQQIKGVYRVVVKTFKNLRSREGGMAGFFSYLVASLEGFFGLKAWDFGAGTGEEYLRRC